MVRMSRGSRTIVMLACLGLVGLVDGGEPAAQPVARHADPLRAAQETTPTLYPGHPRLIVGGYRGVAVAELRAACARPELMEQCAQIGGRHILDDAMRYLLVGDGAAADRVAAGLRAWTSCAAGDIGSEHNEWGGFALAYDWIWATLPPAERRRLDDMWLRCGQLLAGELDSNGPHLWHGYTSLAASLALMALACDGDGDAARCRPLLQAAVDRFRGNALEAYTVVGGAWPEGYNYERSHFFSADPPGQYVMDALRAWDSAVEQDTLAHASLFETIAVEEGDWLRGLAFHVLYGTLDAYGLGGKRTLLRGGDMPTGQAWPNKQYRPFVDSIARAYGDGVLAKWGRDLEAEWSFVGGDGTYHPIHRYSLPYNLPLDVPSVAPDDADAPGGPLPLGRIWARDDLGYVIARSGWDAGETTLGYRAGKWFTGHQHLDQGHLDLWRKGPLAVDAGVYASWGTPHREAYYMRTVAHNTLLIPRIGETFDQHPALGSQQVNDGGQRIHTYARGGCAQCMQSVAEWRSNVGAGLHFEAGRIDAFADAPAYIVVSSDLTSAYNATAHATAGNAAKVASVQRDVVFLRPDLVIVTDRVRTTDGTSPPRFTLHLPGRPALDEVVVDEGTLDDGILHSDTDRFTFDNGTGGRLTMRALAPLDAGLTAVGGPGHRYWVDGANRDAGASGLEGMPAEPGMWRVESASRNLSTAGRNHLLVHALTVTDTGRTALPVFLSRGYRDRPGARAAHVVVQDGDGVVRAVVQSASVPRERVVTANLSVSGTVPLRLELLATDLEPRMTHVVCFMPCTQPNRWTKTSDDEGILYVRSERSVDVSGGSAVFLARCPPVDGESDWWRQVCAEPDPLPTSTAPSTPAPTASVKPAWDGRALLPWGSRFAR
ncbi:MAG: heparinase II/III family protein [Ardenticatenales bacterium]|nr:heparinase II/III family protein [Ardenticatenales bacterium]